MAIIKCKMCGGSLELTEGVTVAQCEYCGTTQTVPTADNDKKLVLFERADRLRRQCEFDKASGVYETIVEDFPNEAEAYWGLVLCKFGIEYVDDPATGKKVPTCHRSSFDNVLADDNYQQALENADDQAARVYRDEAKSIERLRKGIVEVSAKEDPYDIFICYKETAASGGRTPDSVIAQDIYDALTARGYRVFFSRITLEDKLGIDYEPYIFAALNSAKLMLAVGTEYDHYHAVWVKNEWSRYLQLMAKDKDKHLIPCYRDVEPEDLPVPFQRLQGQDMGKIGAMQDLLRGVEKLLPRADAAKETVVLQQAAGPNVASLLHRGNMALEDGNWGSADKFFEEVLNSDSKSGAAYLGKVLAKANCVSLHAYVQQLLHSTEGAGFRTCQITKDTQRHSAIIENYTIFYYLPADKIRTLLEFNGAYGSQVTDRKRQLAEEKQRWNDNKLLARAEQFAEAALAEQIQTEKAVLLDTLTQRIKAAEENEAKYIEQVRSKYAAHLDETEARVRELNEKALKQQAEDLATYKDILENSRNVDDLATLKGTLRTKFQNNPEAEELYKLCGRRIFTIEEEALAVRSAILKRTAIIVAIVAAVIAIILLTINVIIPSIRYGGGKKLMEQGKYDEAIEVFAELGDFSDAPQQIVNCLNGIADDKYDAAMQLMQAGKYEEAITVLESLDDHKDSAAQIEACNIGMLDKKYDAALQLMQAGEYEEAITLFSTLDGHKDSAAQIDACNIGILDDKYDAAAALMADGHYEKAIEGFLELSGHKDSAEQISACKTQLAAEYEANGDHENAIKWYQDANDMANSSRVMYEYVQQNKNNTDTTTYEYLKTLYTQDYKDSKDIYKKLYKINVKVIFNTSKDDTTTSMSVIYDRTSRGYQDPYAHYRVTGGPPVESFELRFVQETRWGADNNIPKEPYKVQRDGNLTVKADGESNVYYLHDGSNLYYHRVTVYDPFTGEQLTQAVLFNPFD